MLSHAHTDLSSTIILTQSSPLIYHHAPYPTSPRCACPFVHKSYGSLRLATFQSADLDTDVPVPSSQTPMFHHLFLHICSVTSCLRWLWTARILFVSLPSSSFRFFLLPSLLNLQTNLGMLFRNRLSTGLLQPKNQIIIDEREPMSIIRSERENVSLDML